MSRLDGQSASSSASEIVRIIDQEASEETRHEATSAPVQELTTPTPTEQEEVHRRPRGPGHQPLVAAGTGTTKQGNSGNHRLFEG